jgi:hypothetical protein
VNRKRLEALENPEINFTATVEARELRFDKVPETKVQFWGHPELHSVSGTERKNLPEEVSQGVRYRNVSVQLRIASELGDTRPYLWEREKEE